MEDRSEGKLAVPSDLHPHDSLLSDYFKELLLAKAELAHSRSAVFRSTLGFVEPLHAGLLSSALNLDDAGSGDSSANKRLRFLLKSEQFGTVLPALLERINTRTELLHLPRRGKQRNLDRAELDTFYTPIDLAKWIASLTAKKASMQVLGRIQNAHGSEEAIGQIARDLSNLRVGDFSCGSGVLLREAAEWIAHAYEILYKSTSPSTLSKLPNEKLFFFKRGLFKLQCITANLYGIDISAKSLEAAKLVLLLWANEDLKKCPVELRMASLLLDLNLRFGSGAHWEICRDHILVDRTIYGACLKAMEHRLACRGRILSGDPVLEERDAGSEIVYVFPEAFVDATPGFSCIVGNPPYGMLPRELEVEFSKSLFDGVSKVSQPRNQYTKFTSSLLHLLREEGFGAIVTPLGLAYNNSETHKLRSEIQRQPRRWSFAFFDRSPDSLFGDTVKTRNIVLFCEPSLSASPEIRTTNLLRWTRASRPELWERVNPTALGAIDISEFVPKLGSDLEQKAWRLVRSRPTYLRGSLSRISKAEDSALFCYSTAYNWLPIFRRNPAFFADEKQIASSSTRRYSFRSSNEADFFYACLVSSLSFWLWTVESDGFHVTASFIEKLPYAPSAFEPLAVAELSELGRSHDEVIRRHPSSKTNAGKNILNFNRHAAAGIIDRIDSLLVSALGIPEAFTEPLKSRIRELIFVGRQTTRVHTLGNVTS